MGLASDYTLVMIVICPLLTKPNPLNNWRTEDLNYLPQTRLEVSVEPETNKLTRPLLMLFTSIKIQYFVNSFLVPSLSRLALHHTCRCAPMNQWPIPSAYNVKANAVLLYHQFIILFAFNINPLHLKNGNLKLVSTSWPKSNVVLRIEIEIKVWSQESRKQNRDHYLRRCKLVLRVESWDHTQSIIKEFLIVGHTFCLNCFSLYKEL